MVLDIYTDAGGCGIRKIRIGAVVVNQNDPDYKGYKFSRKTTVNLVKDKLGFKTEQFKSNSTIAEMYSIREVLKEVMTLDVDIKTINIYTDSMISFNICNGLQRKIKCELLKRINESIISFKSVLKNTEINFMWIKGHAGTWGNEEADLLCKAHQEEVNEIQQILPK